MLKVERIEGPALVRPGGTYSLKVTFRNVDDRPLRLCAVCVGSHAKESLSILPLGWDMKDRGLPPSRNWWIYYYYMENVAPNQSSDRRIEFDVSSRRPLGMFTLRIAAGGYSEDLEKWIVTDWASKRVMLTSTFQQLAEEVISWYRTPTPPDPKDTSIANFLPTRLLEGWKVDAYAPESRKVRGYLNGISAYYSDTQGSASLRISVHKLRSNRSAMSFFNELQDIWWNEHRRPGEVSRTLLKGIRATRWAGQDHILYGWRHGSFVFTIHLFGSEDEDLLRKFVELVGY